MWCFYKKICCLLRNEMPRSNKIINREKFPGNPKSNSPTSEIDHPSQTKPKPPKSFIIKSKTEKLGLRETAQSAMENEKESRLIPQLVS